MILRVSNRQLKLLEGEAQREHPVEACALLFGKLTEKEAVVDRVTVTPNALKSNVRFEIDSKAFYDAFTNANKDGLAFVGFFHSHPAPAEPSSVDLQFMRLWGDAVWLILSTIEHRFAAFQMRDGEAYALTLRSKGKLKEQ